MTQRRMKTTREARRTRVPTGLDSESGKPLQNHQSPQERGQRRKRDVSAFMFSINIILNGFVPGGPRVEVEYEHEMESVPLTKEKLANW